MHNIKKNFFNRIDSMSNWFYIRRGVVPKFSDIAVISLILTAECLGIDSKSYLFSKLNAEYNNEFGNMISGRQYNDRRKLLYKKPNRFESCFQQEDK